MFILDICNFVIFCYHRHPSRKSQQVVCANKNSQFSRLINQCTLKQLFVDTAKWTRCINKLAKYDGRHRVQSRVGCTIL